MINLLTPLSVHVLGYWARQIAGQLNRHHSIIARELKRNTQQTYQAELADE